MTLASRDMLAQTEMGSQDFIQLGAQAIGVVTRESPAIHGHDLTEGYLTQPVLMGQFSPWGELFSLKTTLDFEGATMKRGELNAGITGEGYIDRRHPHTYLHELLVSSAKRFGMSSVSGVSVTVGKGFAPFGTDDPMTRPFEKYPINHHLSQILERAVTIAAARTRFVSGEIGLFNGDEPERPGQWPRISGRFGDSPDDTVGGVEERSGNDDAKRLGRSDVDDQLRARGAFHR